MASLPNGWKGSHGFDESAGPVKLTGVVLPEEIKNTSQQQHRTQPFEQDDPLHMYTSLKLHDLGASFAQTFSYVLISIYIALRVHIGCHIMTNPAIARVPTREWTAAFVESIDVWRPINWPMLFCWILTWDGIFTGETDLIWLPTKQSNATKSFRFPSHRIRARMRWNGCNGKTGFLHWQMLACCTRPDLLWTTHPRKHHTSHTYKEQKEETS